MGKSEQMAELRAAAHRVYASVCDPGVALVWGEGNLNSPLVIVGEAPGAREDELGRPFVGPSGMFLDEELRLAGIDRSRAYITGTVKCRCLRPGTSANRPPTNSEIDAWHEVLMREIQIVAPQVILCLGRVAASALIRPHFSMSKDRGIWFTGPSGIRALATYHPAYLRRFARAADDARLRDFSADLSTVADALNDV